MKYEILEEKVVFDSRFKIIEGTIKHDSFRGGARLEITRLNFERGDSVAIIVWEEDTKSLLFTNQFRYSTIRHDSGWLLELVAGSLKNNENPEDCVKREVEEEIGYKISSLKHLYTFYVSPGATSERIHLYFSEVNSRDKIADGGGVIQENEDIQLIKLSIDKVEQMLENGSINDAKSIIGIQWLLSSGFTKLFK